MIVRSKLQQIVALATKLRSTESISNTLILQEKTSYHTTYQVKATAFFFTQSYLLKVVQQSGKAILVLLHVVFVASRRDNRYRHTMSQQLVQVEREARVGFEILSVSIKSLKTHSVSEPSNSNAIVTYLISIQRDQAWSLQLF
jgi:hypothetical protein